MFNKGKIRDLEDKIKSLELKVCELEQNKSQNKVQYDVVKVNDFEGTILRTNEDGSFSRIEQKYIQPISPKWSLKELLFVFGVNGIGQELDDISKCNYALRETHPQVNPYIPETMAEYSNQKFYSVPTELMDYVYIYQKKNKTEVKEEPSIKKGEKIIL